MRIAAHSLTSAFVCDTDCEIPCRCICVGNDEAERRSYVEALTQFVRAGLHEFAEPSVSRPARFGVRAMAALIDALILAILTNIVGLALRMIESRPMFCVMAFGYVAVLLARFGTTTGSGCLASR